MKFIFYLYSIKMITLNDIHSQTILDMPSNPSISSNANFSGVIKFTIDQPGENVVDIGKQSCFGLGVQIAMTREGSNDLHTLQPIINSPPNAGCDVFCRTHLFCCFVDDITQEG